MWQYNSRAKLIFVQFIAEEQATVETDEHTEISIEASENESLDLLPKVAVPSAPAIEDLEVKQSPPHLMYPNLDTIQSFELAANAMRTKERIILQPFTNEQLKELYSNPELQTAEVFESEFINTELNSTYKDHPLYELIKKYSHSRYNLKVNMLDLHGYINGFQENSQKVWIIENRITTYEGVCTDGERIRKNELYE